MDDGPDVGGVEEESLGVVTAEAFEDENGPPMEESETVCSWRESEELFRSPMRSSSKLR